MKEEIKSRLEKCLENSGYSLDQVWTKLGLDSFSLERSIESLLKFIVLSSPEDIKVKFYEMLDKEDLGCIKSFCDSLSTVDKFTLLMEFTNNVK